MKVRATTKSGDSLFRAWSGGAMALMVVAALLVVSCGAVEGEQGGEGGAEGTASTAEEAGQTRPVESVTVEEITNNPSEFYGESVTVSGQVVEAVEPGAFRIDSEGDQLLVVGAQQLSKIAEGEVKEVNEGDRIRVTGLVRQFKIEEVRQEVDRGIDNEYFGDFEGDPAVLATSVEVIS